MLSAGSVGWFARCDEEFIANGLQGVCWLGGSARRDDPSQSLVMQMHTRYAGKWFDAAADVRCVRAMLRKHAEGMIFKPERLLGEMHG